MEIWEISKFRRILSSFNYSEGFMGIFFDFKRFLIYNAACLKVFDHFFQFFYFFFAKKIFKIKIKEFGAQRKAPSKNLPESCDVEGQIRTFLGSQLLLLNTLIVLLA